MSLEAWGDDAGRIQTGTMSCLASDWQRVHAERDALRAVLQQAVEVIKQWHNMGGGEDVWQIYYENAPEMKLIRETLTRSTDRRE